METNGYNKKLNTDLLLKYIDRFYGYGSWEKSNFWFIGIEEGGGDNFTEVQKRLTSWQSLGEKSLVDKDILHNDFCLNYDRFTHKSTTWNALIAIKLSFENRSVDKETICLMKGTDWGQLSSKNLLVELFPLPSPGTGVWKYPCWIDENSDLKFLNNKNAYHSKISTKRVKEIKEKIQKHRPNVVLFYGLSMKRYWDEIIESRIMEEIEILPGRKKINFITINGTCYIQTPHPTTQFGRLPNEYWRKLGLVIRSLADR